MKIGVMIEGVVDDVTTFSYPVGVISNLLYAAIDYLAERDVTANEIKLPIGHSFREGGGSITLKVYEVPEGADSDG